MRNGRSALEKGLLYTPARESALCALWFRFSKLCSAQTNRPNTRGARRYLLHGKHYSEFGNSLVCSGKPIGDLRERTRNLALA